MKFDQTLRLALGRLAASSCAKGRAEGTVVYQLHAPTPADQSKPLRASAKTLERLREAGLASRRTAKGVVTFKITEQGHAFLARDKGDVGSVEHFLRECCVPGDDNTAKCSDVFKAHDAFRRRHSLKVVSPDAVSRRLSKAGHRKSVRGELYTRARTRVFEGFKVRQ